MKQVWRTKPEVRDRERERETHLFIHLYVCVYILFTERCLLQIYIIYFVYNIHECKDNT